MWRSVSPWWQSLSIRMFQYALHCLLWQCAHTINNSLLSLLPTSDLCSTDGFYPWRKNQKLTLLRNLRQMWYSLDLHLFLSSLSPSTPPSLLPLLPFSLPPSLLPLLPSLPPSLQSLNIGSWRVTEVANTDVTKMKWNF